jgi:hypothetical protein
MIIGINGKIGAGKDTVGTIIQKLLYTNKDQTCEIKKFAGKLKTIASILTGIPVEKFEDQEFKKVILGEEWGTVRHNPLNNIEPFAKFLFNELMSVRELLQKLGTEAMRDGLHTNVWVNALFADYKYEIHRSEVPTRAAGFIDQHVYPNWIITDVRFPNELEAVVERKGITIRVVREKLPIKHSKTGKTHLLSREAFTEHPSETALDDAKFDYEIFNDGTMEELVEKVREILITEKLI